MRLCLLLLAVVVALCAAPAASAAPSVLEHGRFAGSLPPAAPFAIAPSSPVRSFKVEVLS